MATHGNGTFPLGVAYNGSTGRLYMANFLANTVTVMEGGTGTVVGTVPVGARPAIVAVDSATNRIYVANSRDNTMSVIDGNTNAVVGVIPVGVQPLYGIAVNSPARRAYVTNFGGNDVSVQDSSRSPAGRADCIRNCRNPRACLICPNTGSTIILRVA